MKYAIRSMFVPEPGHLFLAFDFSQAETWIVAHLANEQNMKYYLKNSHIHTETAKIIYNTQIPSKENIYIGKRQNHANSYGQGYRKSAAVINADSDKPPYVTVTEYESKVFNERWHAHYKIKGWWADVESELNRNHRTLRTPYGRKRTFYGPWGDDLLKEAIAYVPQSTVADHTFGAEHPELRIQGGIRAVSKLQFIRNGEGLLKHTAHDSVMLSVQSNIIYDVMPEVYRCLVRPLIVNDQEFIIPVECEVGERWGELEKVSKDKLQ